MEDGGKVLKHISIGVYDFNQGIANCYKTFSVLGRVPPVGQPEPPRVDPKNNGIRLLEPLKARRHNGIDGDPPSARG